MLKKLSIIGLVVGFLFLIIAEFVEMAPLALTGVLIGTPGGIYLLWSK